MSHERGAAGWRPATRGLAALAVGAVGSLVAGCAGDQGPFEPRYSTPHAEIGTAFEAELCGGAIELLEAQAEMLSVELDGLRESPLWVHLYLGNQGKELMEKCGLGVPVNGCYADPAVHSVWGSASHEMVHAQLWDYNEWAVDLLEEGVAVFMSGTVRSAEPVQREQVTEQLLEAALSRNLDYELAGHFVQWLWETHGADLVVELYGQASSKMSARELSSVFEEVLGASVEETVAAYVAAAPRFYPGVGPFACGRGEGLDWDGQDAEMRGRLACDGAGVLGQYDENREIYALWKRWSLEVHADGIFEFVIDGGRGAITRCLTTAADDAPEAPGSVYGDWSLNAAPLQRNWGAEAFPPGTIVELPAGAYDLWVAQFVGEHEGPFTMTLRRQ